MSLHIIVATLDDVVSFGRNWAQLLAFGVILIIRGVERGMEVCHRRDWVVRGATQCKRNLVKGEWLTLNEMARVSECCHPECMVSRGEGDTERNTVEREGQD